MKTTITAIIIVATPKSGKVQKFSVKPDAAMMTAETLRQHGYTINSTFAVWG